MVTEKKNVAAIGNVRKLYRLIRGICSRKPGVSGMTEAQ